MRPDDTQATDGGAAATDRARTLWAELAGVYDALEAAVAAGAFVEAARLTPRLGALEAALAPVWAEVQTARWSMAPALAAVWSALDADIARLQTRCRALTAQANGARAATARALASARVGRAQTQDYARGPVAPPRFTSRRV